MRLRRSAADDKAASQAEGTTPDVAEGDREPVELLHPFYLDTDMSMTFAAAVAGGVALQREEVEHDRHESAAVRNLRGNLRLAGALDIGGGRERSDTESVAATSRLVRQHTEASIFIALHDELRQSGRIIEYIDVSTLQPGNIVSLEIGPAVAPLRRVVDQIVRLLNVAEPMVAGEREAQDASGSAGLTRQQRRQQAREAAKQALAEGDEAEPDLLKVKGLFVALQEDLDQSGMVDVVVHREDAPSVILTLDKRLASDQVLELLHTSTFTVIGKVTQVWSAEGVFVNLYRRSVMSLVPALGQMVTWSMFNLLASLASGIDVKAAERAARAAAGVEEEADEPAEQSEVMLGDAVIALNPAVSAPAIQVLPLAICT